MEVVFNNNVQNKNEQFENSSSDIFDNQLYGVAIYKGSVTFVKRICKKSVDLTRNVRKELIQVKTFVHYLSWLLNCFFSCYKRCVKCDMKILINLLVP